MQVHFQYYLNLKKPLIPKVQAGNFLALLSCDTVSFGSIKKNSLEGFDLVYANMSKAPLERFNSKEDYNIWIQEKLKMLYDSNKYNGSNEAVNRERNKILQEWKDYLHEENNIYIENPALSAIIFLAIVKDLDKDNSNIPPILNKGVLSDTVGQIKDSLKIDSKYQFNFNKIYQNKLRIYYTQGIKEVKDPNISSIEGWIRIPSKINNPKNFEKNVKKLKLLSNKSWCTKSTHAEQYLEKGDFHIYYEKGNPQIGIRFIGNQIQEIQGEANNGNIPIAYLDEVKNYIHKNGFRGGQIQIMDAQICKQELEKAKLFLRGSITKKDYKTILEYFGFEVKILEDKTFEISHYEKISSMFTFKDLSVDENDLFRNVSRIKGSADFQNSQITDLGNLQSIGGSAYFGHSQIINLGHLQSIGDTANFRNSRITDLGNLQLIGGSAYFENSQITDLGNLQSIGDSAYFENSQITDLGNLQSIGGGAYFENSKIKSLGNLQSLGGRTHFKKVREQFQSI